MKEIDSAQSWIQKLSQKMTKLRHELGEQKRKLASMPPTEASAVHPPPVHHPKGSRLLF